MNVIFIIDTLQTGGAEKSLLEITRHFKKYNPVFIQLFDKSSDLKKDFDLAGIRVINMGLKQSYHFGQISNAAWQQIHPLKPVLIHATLFMSDMVSRKLPLHDRIPLINSFVNNSYSKQRYRSEPFPIKTKLWCLQQWDAITAKKVTAFVSNSESIKITNAKALRIPSDKIKVIYRGRSLRSFTGISEDHASALRKELNPGNKKVFLNVSRLIDRKGQLDLIKAFHKVIQENENCLLWIAGEGPLRRMLEERIDSLSLQQHVQLLGNRNDIPLLLKAADYFVFPSHYEGLPGAIIEAMFTRVPIIASSIPENLECVNEEMALLHPVKDIKALAQQMLNALSNELWLKSTQKAFDYAMEHFEISKVAQQYEALYDEVIAQWKINNG